MAKFCKNCGKEINEEQDVCLNCGKKIEKQEMTKGKLIVNIIASIAGFVVGYLVVHLLLS